MDSSNAVVLLSGRGGHRALLNTDFRERDDRTERSAAAERIEPTLANEPTEKADKKDPMQPTDSTEPTEPIERIEPREPTHRIEFSDLIESSERFPAAMPPMMTYAAGHLCHT